MVLLEKLWDDVQAGPLPDRGLGRLRKVNPKPLRFVDRGKGMSDPNSKSMSISSESSPSSPAATTPGTPASPTTPSSARRDNVWRSVFNPGSNLATKGIGADVFDKPNPNSPTVYDWLYSGETRSNHR